MHAQAQRFEFGRHTVTMAYTKRRSSNRDGDPSPVQANRRRRRRRPGVAARGPIRGNNKNVAYADFVTIQDFEHVSTIKRPVCKHVSIGVALSVDVHDKIASAQGTRAPAPQSMNTPLHEITMG
jgi:hypothetical protein